jgi:hypothetical protein
MYNTPSLKSIIFSVFMFFFIPKSNLYAQIWEKHIGDNKIKALSGEKGFVIENLSYFKKEVINELSPISSLQKNDEEIKLEIKKADSIHTLLNLNKTAILQPNDLPLISYFSNTIQEPEILANLILSINRLGGVKSLNYSVTKNDTIFIEYTVIKGAGFDEFEIIEGKELRYSFAKSQKKNRISTQIIIKNNGTITLNFTNRGITRSKINVIVTQKKATPQYAVHFKCDTSYQTVKSKKQIIDTLNDDLISKEINITSKNNITRSNKIRVPISFNIDRDYFAWGYWIGVPQKDNFDNNNLFSPDSSSNSLTQFILAEIKQSQFVQLPVQKSKDIQYSISNHSGLPIRTAEGLISSKTNLVPLSNFSHNFGGWLIQKSNESDISVDLFIENRSSLYDYKLIVRAVGLYFSSHEIETEIIEKSCKEYIILSLI